MKPLPITAREADSRVSPLARLVHALVDAPWYKARYPDIAASDLDPYQHFIRFGATEKRDPNPFFDGAWYMEHYPDVAASGLNPLLHYMQSGAAELRNPHPRFDAIYYVDQHPAAAANPLLYHLQAGVAAGYLTEKAINIRDYLPSEHPALALPLGVFADVVILAHAGIEETKRCLRSVLADRAFPLGRIIVVDDCLADPAMGAWLRNLAAEGQIHLIRNRRCMGFSASANLGIEAAEAHDVVLLNNDIEVPAGWLRRLTAHAYAQPNIATISPLTTACSIGGVPVDEDAPPAVGETPTRMDELYRTINAGRAVDVPEAWNSCVYIRRAALTAAGAFETVHFTSKSIPKNGFCARAVARGWRHRIACDIVVYQNENRSPELRRPVHRTTPEEVIPFQFAVTAAMFRDSKLPVILLISHNLGGGVGRHIDSLIERYRSTARMLLLEATDRGAALSVASLRGHPVLTLPSERLDDLVIVLRSTGLSRIHIHHLLQMDMDIRALVHRLGVPFDVTVHDYFAICPQINLLRWQEGLYCGEPGPAACNACIADQSSHGARDIVSWRRDSAWQFLDADRVICPSTDVKRRLDRHRVGERAVVVPHEQQTETIWNPRLPTFAGPPLRIVLLGVLANHKGARLVAEVAEVANIVVPGTIEIHLIGHLEAGFPKPARRLIKVTGRYRDRDLQALLERIDPHVFWFPSSAPETYSYTLSTAIATGLPIVATDLGSFTERLNGRPLSWLVDYRASAKDWLAVFDAVQRTLRERVDQPPVSRPVSISDFYDERYLLPPARLVRPVAARGSDQAPAVLRDIRISRRNRRIAIVPERYDAGGLTMCAYIRLLQPLDHAAIGGRFDIVLADTETILDHDADIIVTQRYAIPDVGTADRLAEHARRTGAKLLFDLDDDLLNVPLSHPDASTLRPFGKVVRRMLTVSDAVWVSTSGLAERLASIRPDALVIENRLDERIWIHDPAHNGLWDDPIRILCMGTSTRDRDFALIEPALRRLKAEYGDRIIIDILGMTRRGELPPELNRIGPSTHAARSYPGFVNWLTTTRPRWHIGLAPLLDTSFNRSKSPIKAMDYAAIGLSVLASDTPAYRGSIADGPAGQLVANDHRSWHAALDWLIRNQNLRERAAVQAREAFLTQATLASYVEIRQAALEKLFPNRTLHPDADLREAPPALTISNGSTDPITRKSRHSGRGR